ncbi:GNAT family N-acetyltransferase [Lactobacillus sp. S2-2]|uniref:GNAT family N-acetyltransferase n=1 Tax=Lactobacillus sp. S2-2 TaxID=2692917 RepID=UPI001F1C75BE|nr:GNAT family protein [Lactobacillus sp. S2-2]MCF6515841.1 GNAT family N-acetyltransferase [Lactobacillus sp. S2-2]
MTLQLKNLDKKRLKEYWKIAYGDPHAKWMEYNGPYFEDEIPTYRKFKKYESKKLITGSNYKVIIINDKIIGTVGSYYEDNDLKKWLDIGIIIFDENNWSKGIGLDAMSKWIDYQFSITKLPHIGLTTWSGNPGMIKLSKKLGLNEEAYVPKVRYWERQYWDSIKYGILREEWENKKN